MRLILASSSPRRQELLRYAGFKFDVRPSHVEETPRRGERADAYARRAAREKALRVGLTSPPSSLVLGADTVVEINGEILGKPAGPEDAARMLRRLSGSTHRLMTAVCVVRPPRRVEALEIERTSVSFRNLNEDEIRAYVATGEPFDKAGAYAIQGLAGRFVTRIEGSYSNVVGLPLSLVCELLRSLGRDLCPLRPVEPTWFPTVRSTSVSRPQGLAPGKDKNCRAPLRKRGRLRR